LPPRLLEQFHAGIKSAHPRDYEMRDAFNVAWRIQNFYINLEKVQHICNRGQITHTEVGYCYHNRASLEKFMQLPVDITGKMRFINDI
jgi:hypothetical protein